MRKRKSEVPHPPTKVGIMEFVVPVDDAWHKIPCGRSTMYHGDLPLGVGITTDGKVLVWGVWADPLSDCTTPVKVVRDDRRWDSRNNYLGTVLNGNESALHVIAGGFE